MFAVDSEHILDATKCGNRARYVNHSCMPNSEARIISPGGKKRIVFQAMKPLEGGEEITV